jgi:hypothetical protein
MWQKASTQTTILFSSHSSMHETIFPPSEQRISGKTNLGIGLGLGNQATSQKCAITAKTGFGQDGPGMTCRIERSRHLLLTPASMNVPHN